MANRSELSAAWSRIIDLVKDNSTNPTLFVTIENTTPIILDGDVMIVGLAPAYHSSRSLIERPEINSLVEQALEKMAKRPIKVRYIDGLTMKDWENVKLKEEASLASSQQQAERRRIEKAADKTWDSLLEQISRQYANSPQRQLPQGRARYVDSILDVVAASARELVPAGGTDELAERGLARVIEKVATLADIPSVLVAYELLKRLKDHE